MELILLYFLAALVGMAYGLFKIRGRLPGYARVLREFVAAKAQPGITRKD